jgi:putative tryptophan/tyrosine transport system substrate-binding protein
MKRREFITLLGGAVACALGASATHAQQSVTPVVGYLSVRSNDNYLVEALRRGLRETGYVEGQNVAVEYRWAMGRYDRMPAMAAETRSAAAGRPRYGWWRARGAGGQGRDFHHSDRVCHRR